MPLPKLIEINDYADFRDFQDDVYGQFCGDFCDKPSVLFCGRPLVYSKTEKLDGKCTRFWHIVTEGPIEEEREPKLDRYARIGWVRYMVDNRLSGDFAYWRHEKRLRIATRTFDYVVVMHETRKSIILVTAFPLGYRNAAEQLKRQYEAAEQLA